MRQFVLQNIPKVEPMYSAGCPTDDALPSSEYAEEKVNVYLSTVKTYVICYCEDVCDMLRRQSSRWLYCVLPGTIRMEAVGSSEYPKYSCRKFSTLT